MLDVKDKRSPKITSWSRMNHFILALKVGPSYPNFFVRFFFIVLTLLGFFSLLFFNVLYFVRQKLHLFEAHVNLFWEVVVKVLVDWGLFIVYGRFESLWVFVRQVVLRYFLSYLWFPCTFDLSNWFKIILFANVRNGDSAQLRLVLEDSLRDVLLLCFVFF